jgi:hypothetical protein
MCAYVYDSLPWSDEVSPQIANCVAWKVSVSQSLRYRIAWIALNSEPDLVAINDNCADARALRAPEKRGVQHQVCATIADSLDE